MPQSKTIFRQNCIKKLKDSSTCNKVYKDLKINIELQKELRGVKNKKVLIYIPFGFEANIGKAIAKLRQKCEVYTPFMVEQSFKMVPFRLPLKKKKFGIYEAGNTSRDIKKIDIAIVPIVGIDANLQRIGFGKGMYDRFFENLKKKPYTIFIQPKLCYTNEFICDDYDVTCDLLITPYTRIKNKERKIVKRNPNRWLNCYR